MTRVIDASGIAKPSGGNALREFTNELARVRRRLRRAKVKLQGLRALKKDLQPRLPAEEYEYLATRLQREVKQWRDAELELSSRCHDEWLRQDIGNERFEKVVREREELARRMQGVWKARCEQMTPRRRLACGNDPGHGRKLYAAKGNAPACNNLSIQ